MNKINKIDAYPKTLSELLGNDKYTIDYYQREYKWKSKHINELLYDLESKFMDNYCEDDDWAKVQYYSHYFLGPIIISIINADGRKPIIDGQQRLISLTLLLIYLKNLQKQMILEEQRINLNDLIFSSKHGKKTFNIDVPERTRKNRLYRCII